MKPFLPRVDKNRAFSMIEVVSVISLLSLLALIGIATLGKLRPAAEASKLRSDVVNLNSAIGAYKHSGGDLSGIDTPEQVIAKLKTIRQTSTAESFVGLTGAMVDPRVTVKQVRADYAGERAVYDPVKQKFVMTKDKVAGYQFELGHLDDANPTEEFRTDSVLKFATESTWVWEYGDTKVPERLSPTLVALANSPAASTTPPQDILPPDAPALEKPQKLLAPVFSLPSGHYPLGDFSLELTLTNPNGEESGKIIYGIVSDSNWTWEEYTGPLQVPPSATVVAFIQSSDLRKFLNADPRNEQFDWVAPLQQARASSSEMTIDARTGSTTITIADDNHPDSFDWNGQPLPFPKGSFTVQYQLVPTIEGEGTATPWADYQGPFEVGGPQFPRGFDVVTRVVANNEFFTDSPENRTTVLAHYKLDPPVITSDRQIITSPTDVATITLSNPNPTGSSYPQYRILDKNGTVLTGWTDYSGPFVLSGQSYPLGFKIEARAEPSEDYYRVSDTATYQVYFHFFGIELTGKTIFILDVSGSMKNYDRLERLKSATTSVLELFGDSESFGIITYKSSAATLSGWGPATSIRKQQAISQINALLPGGGTSYVSGLGEGLKLGASDATQVIFLSDGYPNSTTGVIDLVQQFVDQGVERFDTIGLGISTQILVEMAAAGNGSSVTVSDID